MTGTSTAGADWKGGGEIKALRRIVGGSAEEDEDAPAPVGHNRPPQTAVHEMTVDEIALEERALVFDRAIEGAEAEKDRVGRIAIELRALFHKVELGRSARIMRLRADGLTLAQIGKQVGLTQSAVLYQIRIAADGREARPSKGSESRFLDWAQKRFKRPRETIRHYITYARNPEGWRIKNKKRLENTKRAYRLGALVLASENENVAPTVFKKAVLALGERDSPARVSVLCWYIAAEVGSEDPQEVARWFAAHRLV